MAEVLVPAILIVLIGVAGLFLYAQGKRDIQKLKRQRADFIAPVYHLFESFKATQERTNFPVIDGRYRGFNFQLDLCVDALTFRKLPTLWLRVSLIAPLPCRYILDILARAQNTEFFSPANDLPHHLHPPEGWPKDMFIKVSDLENLPAFSLLERHIRYFDEVEAKEMLITPRGVRLVYLIDQANRSEYLVLRNARFEKMEIDHQLVQKIMDRAIDLYQDLANNKNGTESERSSSRQLEEKINEGCEG